MESVARVQSTTPATSGVSSTTATTSPPGSVSMAYLFVKYMLLTDLGITLAFSITMLPIGILLVGYEEIKIPFSTPVIVTYILELG